MKGFAFVLLCVLVAVQGRSTEVQRSSTVLAAPGENPWLCHLRMATWTGAGMLNTGAGSLISPRWVLTTSTCVDQARFIWIRYGATTVINPELVTESSTIRDHPTENVALISINRNVEPSANIQWVPLAGAGGLPFEPLRFCGFGQNENNGPGDVLSCFDVTINAVSSEGRFIVTSDGGSFTEHDDGAPLVWNGNQIGFLVNPAVGSFDPPSNYIDWITAETQ